MKDKAVIAVLAAVLIVAAAVGGIFIKNQMKSSDSTGKQTTSMNTVDKTPLQRQSDEVLDKLSYCSVFLIRRNRARKRKRSLITSGTASMRSMRSHMQPQ